MVIEVYEPEGKLIRRSILFQGRPLGERLIEDRSELGASEPLWKKWWRSYLRGSRPFTAGEPAGAVRIVDLFSGCGGLALGAAEAVASFSLLPDFQAAVDVDRDALSVYERNIGPKRSICADVGMLVAYEVRSYGDGVRFASTPRIVHPYLRALSGSVDLVLAGPPCEGYSNLNNKTRRSDPRNRLVIDAVAVAVGLDAKALVVENVADALADRMQAFATAEQLLQGQGYHTVHKVVTASDFAVAQTRRRLFLFASKDGVPPAEMVLSQLRKTPPPDVRWAIEDLEDAAGDVMNRAARLSPETKRRIDYLFDHDLYDLPDSERPTCHRNGHSYKSVYGRLRWDEPAGTITTGFMTMGRGRFVHPSRRRTLTPREAARLQGFPDTIEFRSDARQPPSASHLAKWIGDAVPPPLGYVATMCVLPTLLRASGAKIDA